MTNTDKFLAAISTHFEPVCEKYPKGQRWVTPDSAVVPLSLDVLDLIGNASCRNPFELGDFVFERLNGEEWKVRRLHERIQKA